MDRTSRRQFLRVGLALTNLAALSGCGIRLPQAQELPKVSRIGYLSAGDLSATAFRREPFLQGLRDLGYVEGTNIVIEWRYAEGDPDRGTELAAELVRLNVDVIVTSGGGGTLAAKAATSAIPIVMAQDRDPVGSRFVASLARPGGNVTGLSSLSSEISGKRLELLKEIVPTLSRLAVFGTSTQAAIAQELRETELVAGAFGIKLQYLDVLSPKDIEPAFRAAGEGRADSVLVLVAGRFVDAHQTEIAELAVKSRLPAMYSGRDRVKAGGLVSYGVSLTDLDRRAATYVDKILKGAKPADLPVEQPTKFELIINLKAAEQIGLTIPPNVLARADEVIR
jgi:putative ABC transport system substrate-binding protein